MWRVMSQPSVEELLTEEIDGQKYTYRYVPQCRVCTSPDVLRDLVDALLVAPKTYKETLRLIAPLQQKFGLTEQDKTLITYDSVRTHQKNHMPMDKLAIRELVERKALEKGLDIINGSQNLLDNQMILELVIQKGWDGLVEGSLAPDLRGLMDAIKLQRDFEKETDSEVSHQEVLAKLNLLIMAVKEVVSPEEMQKISERIQQLQESQGQLSPASINN